MELKKTFLVSPNQTALEMGSGNLDVLATPSAIAMAENTCMVLSESLLANNETTVGTFIDFYHLKASLVGATILVYAKLIEQDDKKITFSFELYESEKLIGKGSHKRFIVDKNNFLGNIK